jgi:hypothetical protein
MTTVFRATRGGSHQQWAARKIRRQTRQGEAMRIGIVLLLGACVGCSVAAGSENPLIGHWVPDVIPKGTDGAPASCAQSLDFTAHHQHIVYGGVAPYVYDNEVTYNASKDYVYVIGNQSVAARYNLTGPSQIRFDGWPNCSYKRG